MTRSKIEELSSESQRLGGRTDGLTVCGGAMEGGWRSVADDSVTV